MSDFKLGIVRLGRVAGKVSLGTAMCDAEGRVTKTLRKPGFTENTKRTLCCADGDLLYRSVCVFLNEISTFPGCPGFR